MTPELPVPEPTPTPAGFFERDSIGRGFVLAALMQLGIVIITIPVMLFLAWGLTQWAALLPFYFRFRRKGQVLTAKGILIAGFIGILLNATCAVLVLSNLNIH